MVLLDSLRKRCKFVEGAAAAVGVANAQAVWARAEAAGQNPAHRVRLLIVCLTVVCMQYLSVARMLIQLIICKRVQVYC